MKKVLMLATVGLLAAQLTGCDRPDFEKVKANPVLLDKQVAACNKLSEEELKADKYCVKVKALEVVRKIEAHMAVMKEKLASEAEAKIKAREESGY